MRDSHGDSNGQKSRAYLSCGSDQRQTHAPLFRGRVCVCLGECVVVTLGKSTQWFEKLPFVDACRSNPKSWCRYKVRIR